MEGSRLVTHMPYGIQQPGLSAQIIQLEKSLGKTLFARRPFALTPDGEEMYRSIAPFFDGLDGLETRMKEKGVEFLSITAPPTLLRDHLPKVVAGVQQAFPRLRLRIREANPTQAMVDVGAGVIAGLFAYALAFFKRITIRLRTA
jgi:DNA-binding transcriptional LysR family regulator